MVTIPASKNVEGNDQLRKEVTGKDRENRDYFNQIPFSRKDGLGGMDGEGERRKSIGREMREAEGVVDKEEENFKKRKEILKKAGRMIGLQPVKDYHIKHFLKKGHDVNLNSNEERQLPLTSWRRN